MKIFSLCLLICFTTVISSAQTHGSINADDVKRIETALSADSMEGRKAFTSGSAKAASYISNEFKKAGLQTLKGARSYKQTFSIISAGTLNISASFGSNIIDAKKVISFTCQPDLSVTAHSGFKKVYITENSDLRKRYSEFINLKENLLVFVDSSLAKSFNILSTRKPYLFKSDKSVVLILGNYDTSEYTIKIKTQISEVQGANIVGILPGKSKPDEYVIFSGHYDHLGTDKAKGIDSIYNGANDDASGVTAVISLAKYYKAAHNNERTLVFAAFTAEEIGGYGSQYFSRQFDPGKIAAMFNIEMIGTESKWGKNAAYITGYEKSDMGKILQRNLQGSNFAFHPDPYIEEDLFYRSDNATLARQGVPAHTISTSKMDNEPNYHKLTDEVETLDMENMTQIIRSIAISAKSIISGKDTPTRVNTSDLSR